MLSRSMGRFSIGVLLILSPTFARPSVVEAQASDPTPLAAGVRVRVYTGPSSVVQGDVLRMTGDSIVFREHLSRGKLALALPQVRRIDRSLGHPGLRDRVVGYAIAGALAGGVMSYALSGGDSCTDRPCPLPRFQIALGGGAVFAAIGALVGGVVTPERWETMFDHPMR